jgi:ABC-type dipeptide/oligopeptide/nickel transport system permease subunit
MYGSNFTQEWVLLTGSVAMIALILTAFGLMLGIVKPVNATKHLGAIIGIVIALMLIPGILASVWSSMSLWQQIGLVAVGIAVCKWLRPRRRTRNATYD